MQIANTVASKAIVAVVAAAMIFSAFAAPAKAQSVEEMQKMINDLMAQIAKLQGGSTSTSTGSSSAVCPYTWTRDLRTGATGADVKKLQEFLNSNPDTRVAATGAGSAGMETENFGPATAAAVSKFQVMHRADILTPAGLTNPTGFFGPSTRAKANALCVAGSSNGGDEDEDEDEDNGSVSLSGEASLEDFEVEDASDNTIEEGDEEVEIGLFKITFEDGDAQITRLDIGLDRTGSGGQQNPWQTFEAVSLWVDGDMVAEVEAGAKSDYLSSADGTLRFSGLDIVAMEDEELEITVGATIKSSVRSLGVSGDEWGLTAEALRYVDADGVVETDTTTDDLGGDTIAVFTVEEAGANDEIIVRSSTANPESATLKVEDDKRSDWLTVFAFDIDTDDSVNDIEVDTVTIPLTLSAAYNTVVDNAELYIDGVRVNKFTVSSATATNPTLTFDADDKVTIDAGDRVGAELKLRFRALAVEGTTVQASVDTVTGEGVDTLTSTGAAQGKVHTLRSTGVDVALDSVSAVVTAATQGIPGYGTFKISLDVTAFEQDVYIPINAASTTWSLRDANNATITAAVASTTVVIDSTADEGGAGNAFYEIKEGETETITITVTYTPGAAAPRVARLQLLSLTFDETGTATGADDDSWTALPANTYRTGTITIQN